MIKYLFALVLILSIISCKNKSNNDTATTTPVVEKQNLKISKSDMVKRGKEIAMITKKVLGKNLMGQIKKNSPVAAIGFCNNQASILADSVSNAHNVKITRVSDKPRNKNAQANSLELKMLEDYHRQNEAGEKMKPKLIIQGGENIFYAPIPTNDKCMLCHGQSIHNDIKQKIKELYPQDKAVGYSPKDIRGLWKIVL